jgi:hypothetical protein
MTRPGFEPRIPASERPQTHALGRAATETGLLLVTVNVIYLFKDLGVEGRKTLKYIRKKGSVYGAFIWFSTC